MKEVKRMNGKKKALSAAVLMTTMVIMLVAFMLVVTFRYISYIYEIQENESSAYIQELTDQSVRLIHERIDNDCQYLNGIADSIGAQDTEIYAPSILEILKNRTETTRFTNLAVADREGILYFPEGKSTLQISDREYFRKAIEGVANVESTGLEKGDGQLVVLAVPIFREGEVIGALLGQYQMEEMANLFSTDYFNGAGYNYIVRSDGEVLFTSDRAGIKANYLSDFHRVEQIHISQADTEKTIGQLQAGETGTLRFTLEGEENMLHYTPVGFNDWYFLLVLPIEVVNANVNHILQSSMIYSGVIIMFLGGLLSMALWHKKKNQNHLVEAYEKIQSFYRTAPNSIVQFIMEEKKGKRMTVVNANDAFYEFIKDTRERYQKRYGNDLIPVIVPEDQVWTDGLAKGLSSHEFRIRCSDGEMKWVQGNFDVQTERGKTMVLCAFIDISIHKKQLTRAEKEARIDPLTQLKNKRALEYEIGELLDEFSGIGALLLFDLDNFKLVNDIQGHPTGDLVLQRFAGCLTQVFRSKDFIGRIGGDEFIVFLCGTNQREQIRGKMEWLMDIFREAFEEEMETCQFSVSTGIAVSPLDGCDYETLYSKADQALYFAKNHGKCQFSFYGQTTMI